MGGGLMQLCAYGAQDIYLTGNPQITYFKSIYKRHSNFAIESIEQNLTGAVDFGRKTSCTISRNGDLLHKMYLEIDIFNAATSEVLGGERGFSAKRIGHAMIDYIEIEIGGQCIDKHYGEWLDIWTQLSYSKEQYAKLERMINGSLYSSSTSYSSAVQKLYIPLHFWFNKHPGLALPLIALQYHEVKINLKLKKKYLVDKFRLLESGGDIILRNIKLFCDYIFLDTDERRRFAQVSHEYLIEQVQFNGKHIIKPNTKFSNIKLNFNHPVKELVWVVQPMERLNAGPSLRHFGFSAFDNGDAVAKATIQLNGKDRFIEREGTYFRLVQPYQHHTGGFDHDDDPSTTRALLFEGAPPCFFLCNSSEKGFIYLYSFALNPEDHQPSGTCNFSRIDNAMLNLTLNESATKCDIMESLFALTWQDIGNNEQQLWGIRFSFLADTLDTVSLLNMGVLMEPYYLCKIDIVGSSAVITNEVVIQPPPNHSNSHGPDFPTENMIGPFRGHPVQNFNIVAIAWAKDINGDAKLYGIEGLGLGNIDDDGTWTEESIAPSQHLFIIDQNTGLCTTVGLLDPTEAAGSEYSQVLTANSNGELFGWKNETDTQGVQFGLVKIDTNTGAATLQGDGSPQCDLGVLPLTKTFGMTFGINDALYFIERTKNDGDEEEPDFSGPVRTYIIDTATSDLTYTEIDLEKVDENDEDPHQAYHHGAIKPSTNFYYGIIDGNDAYGTLGGPGSGGGVLLGADLAPEEGGPFWSENYQNQIVKVSIADGAVEAIYEPIKLCHSMARVYATNYNVLRIMSGMGGLAYSN